MDELSIKTQDQRCQYLPGDRLQGVVSWLLDAAPERIELRLFWYTKGKGDQDVRIVETIGYDHPTAREKRDFQFTIPLSPYSFSGKLISLLWALELVAQPQGTTARFDISVSPTGQEILLYGFSQSKG